MMIVMLIGVLVLVFWLVGLVASVVSAVIVTLVFAGMVVWFVSTGLAGRLWGWCRLVWGRFRSGDGWS